MILLFDCIFKKISKLIIESLLFSPYLPLEETEESLINE